MRANEACGWHLGFFAVSWVGMAAGIGLNSPVMVGIMGACAVVTVLSFLVAVFRGQS